MIQAYYVLSYDFPSENEVQMLPSTSDSRERRKEKQSERNYLRNTRLKYYWKFMEMGRYINNSVFLVPESNLKDAEEIVRECMDEYLSHGNGNGRTRLPSIELICFRESESARLQVKAKEILIQDLQDLSKKMSETQFKMGGRKIRDSSVRKAIRETGKLESLVKSFNLEDELKGYLSMVRYQLDDLKGASST
ncbi:MAG: hypothetical protein NTU61_02795 [Candidatus Altiarchaeota archaeon]|nr:hypothetical protein [Candidatus Altiarchaeota archaeon]